MIQFGVQAFEKKKETNKLNELYTIWYQDWGEVCLVLNNNNLLLSKVSFKLWFLLVYYLIDSCGTQFGNEQGETKDSSWAPWAVSIGKNFFVF